MRLKLLFATVALFVVCGKGYGQLLHWNTFGNIGTETTEPTVFNDVNISASNLTLGVGVTAAANGNRFGGSGWFNTGNTLAEAVAGNDYIQFIVTPNSGYSFTPTSFVFIWDFSATGPKNVTLRSSVDNYTADLGVLSNMTASISANKTINIIGLTNSTTATTFRIYGYGATATGGTGGFDTDTNFVNVQLIGTTASTGPTSIASGDWNVGSTWSTGSVPANTDNVTISAAHTVYTSTALTRTGTTNVNGSFQLNSGGWVSDASGTNAFIYGSNGSLIFNAPYVANNGNYWPATNGPVNVTVNSGSDLTLEFSRTVTGTFQTAAGVNLSSSTLTLNGVAQINAGGFFYQSPIYGSSSTLIYNTSGTFGRGNEWTVSAGTIGTTPGYPNDVKVTNTTILNVPNSGNFGNDPSSASFGLARDLTVDVGSNFAMDYGLQGNKSSSVTVSRNINIAGSLSLGDAIGGDLSVGGNWTRTGTFTPKSRLVTFNGSSAQTLNGTTTFDYLTVNNSAGLTLNSTVTVNQTLALTSGKITIGTNNLTVGSIGLITGYSFTNYIVTASTGKLVKQGAGNVATVFPVGFSTTNYTPVTITNTSGTSDLSVSVKQSITNAATDPTKIVTLEWGITSNVATTATISPTWFDTTPINQAASFTNTGTGEIGNFTTAYTTYPVTLSTTTTSATGIALQSGTNLIVVGNTGDVYTAPPANDLCTNAIALTLNAIATNGNLKGSTPTAGLTYSAPSKDVWYSFTPSCTGTFAITLTGFTGDVDMDVFTTSCPTSGTGTSTSHGSTAIETVSASLISGTTYFIRILSFNVAAEKSTFTIQVINNGSLNIANTGSPAAGNILANTNNVVLFGFDVTPSACTTNYDFSSVIITKTLTSTSSDLSNFRIFYDANGDGAISGDSSISGSGIALANSMTFTISGQTGLSAGRKYLLVADVAVLATGGNTFIGKITTSNNLTALLTPTGTVTGTATGNTQTITYSGPEINVTTNTPSSIPTGSIASIGYNTQFAATEIGASTTVKTYRIYNLGSSTLNVSAVTSSNTEFTVTSSTSYAIAPGDYVSFTVIFSPSNSGTRTAVISIVNNDSTNDGALTENPYTFNVKGNGTCATTTNTITPTSGPIGTEVTINSVANLTGATVSFNGISATVIQISLNQIKVVVPSGATSGILVTVNSVGCSATNTFTVVNNLITSCQGGNGSSDLYISEVTDATIGGLSYIEIYNGTGSTINLSNYALQTYSNGSSTTSSVVNLNNVDLTSGSIYVVALGISPSPDALDTCSIIGGNGQLADQVSTSAGINFDTNGNDYIALFNLSTNINVDSFGTYENNTWANSLSVGDRGVVFRRKNTATLPSVTYNNSDWDITNWIGSGSGSCSTNDYSNIGTYTFTVSKPPTVTTHPSYSPTCKATTLTVAATEGYTGGNSLTYKWLVSAPNATGWTELSDTGIYTGTSSVTLSIANISTIINYQYYCQIRENTNTCYTASNAVKIIDGTITWNGTDWRDINNAITTPSLSKLAVINSNYNTAINGDLNACSVIVNAGKVLTVTAQNFVTIQNDLTINFTGKLEVEDKGSLVMINDLGTVTTDGTINIQRKTTDFELYDYTYWSTPIVSTDIETTFTSPSWRTDNAYEFLPANYVDKDDDGYDDNHDDWSFATYMISGKGYIIMVPERPSPFPPYTSATVIFSGRVNNGVVTTPIDLTPDVVPAVADDDFNLVGNPYPSAISADAFINANLSINGTAYNTIEGTLYFWTHIKDLSSSNYGPDTYNYSQDDYAVYTLAGGTAAGSGGIKPLGYIASCQGFFVEAVNAGTLLFNNAMRVGLPATANSQFFKSRPGKSIIKSKDRIWLNLENSLGMFSQQLVGYFDNTTLGYDNGYDGLLSDAGNYVAFYSFIDDKTYKIQGRAAYDENDQIRLGYFSAVAGTFNITIDSKEGVFTNLSSNVYLEDKLLNVTYDLKQSPYTFTTEKGTFNDRFILRYTNKTLGITDSETLEKLVLVSNKNKQIKVNSAVETIDKVLVYDLLGRLIYKKEKVNSNEITLNNLNASQQTLLVKVTLQNGKTVTRKVMY